MPLKSCNETDSRCPVTLGALFTLLTRAPEPLFLTKGHKTDHHATASMSLFYTANY